MNPIIFLSICRLKCNRSIFSICACNVYCNKLYKEEWIRAWINIISIYGYCNLAVLEVERILQYVLKRKVVLNGYDCTSKITSLIDDGVNELAMATPNVSKKRWFKLLCKHSRLERRKKPRKSRISLTNAQ